MSEAVAVKYDTELINAAVSAMKNSYSPYSHFQVGAALLAADGQIFTGCNIENSSFPATVCAERTALGNAVSAGIRRFTALAVVGGMDGSITRFCPPCGICRQVLAEFCEADFDIILSDGKSVRHLTLNALLPEAFGGESLCE